MRYEVNEFDVLDFIKSNVPSDATRRSYPRGDIDSPCDCLDFVPDDSLEFSKKNSPNPVAPISVLFSKLEFDINACSEVSPQVGILLVSACGSIHITVDVISSTHSIFYDLYFDVCTK